MPSIREAIYLALVQTGKKMSAKEIYDYIAAHNLANLSGKTPIATVQAQAGEFIRNNDSRVSREKTKGGCYLYFATEETKPTAPADKPQIDTVPGFQDFLPVILNKLDDKQSYSISDIRQYCISYFNLSEIAQKATIKSGKKTQIAERVHWAVTYLYQARLIEREARGVYHITTRGQDLLKIEHGNIDIKMLSRYDEFVKFAGGKTVEDPAHPEEKPTESEVTPLENLEVAYEKIVTSLKQQLLDIVMKQSPAFFESLVTKLLKAMGYGGSFEDAAKVTPYSHDDGIDGVIKEDKLGFDSIYVQAKRYTTGNVQKPDMQKFIGALTEQSATKGAFITTASFSQGAQETARKAKGVKIVLIDGELLVEYMINHNIGVAVEETYEIKRIDSDFFE